MPLAAGTYAVFTTTEGKITVRLFESDAPITVKNFIELAEGAKEWTHPGTRDKVHRQALRRHHLPSRDSRLHDPGRRPHRHRHGRTRLSLPGRDQGLAAQVRQAGQAGHGQHRPRHQRLPVLHHRRAHNVAHRQPHHLRRSGRRRRRSSPKSPSFRAAARTSRKTPVVLESVVIERVS